MTESVPTVSVVIPVFNGTALIGPTLEALWAQTFTDFEVVIVDDCSTDGTLAMLRAIDEPRLRVIASEANGGPVKARNRGFALARGRYIAGLDHDDIALPRRLERQVAYLDAHPDVALVATAAELLIGDRRSPLPPERTTPSMLDWHLMFANPLVWSSVMFRAETARRLDPITRPERLYAEDFDFYHRLRKLGRIARIDEPLMLYRSHPGGVSKRYAGVMHGNSRAVLADAYAPIFADAADATAEFVSRHLGACEPIPDTDGFARLSGILDRLADWLGPADAQTQVLIEAETARLYRRLVRESVRSGAVLLPNLLGIILARTHAGAWPDLAASGIVGGARRVLGKRRPLAT